MAGFDPAVAMAMAKGKGKGKGFGLKKIQILMKIEDFGANFMQFLSNSIDNHHVQFSILC